ncbi:FecR family protein [Sphingomonas sp. CJ20]
MGGDTQDIDGQAARWVDRMRQPVVDAESAGEFDRWIARDSRHIDAYARLSALWQSDGLESALRSVAATPMPSNDDEATQPERRAVAWRRILGAGAAALCLAIGGVLGTGVLVEEAAFATPRGATRLVALSDGSTIRMNGATRIAVRMTPWSRQVTLEQGEAFFDVAHERLRGFGVDAGGARVSVLGTAFDVDRMDQQTRVVQVYRGLVSVDAGAGRQWRLPAGSGLEVAGDRVRSLRAGAGRPGWIDGWYEANDTPVWQLVERLNRAAPRPIRLADPALGELMVTGRFQTDRPAAVLEAIAAIHDLHWRQGADGYLLSR